MKSPCITSLKRNPFRVPFLLGPWQYRHPPGGSLTSLIIFGWPLCFGEIHLPLASREWVHINFWDLAFLKILFSFHIQLIVWSGIESNVRNNFPSEFKAFILGLLASKLLYASFIFLLLNQIKSDFSSDLLGHVYYSFIQHTRWAQPFASCWKYKNEKDRLGPYPHGAYSLGSIKKWFTIN